MAKCCDKAVTVYALHTALGFLGEHGGEHFARRIVLEAGISLDNEEDAKVIRELGGDVRAMVQRFTDK